MSAGIDIDLPDPEDLERAFEQDLAWLATEFGAEVVSAEPLSPLRGHGRPRTAFRISLSDGRRVKLRRMKEIERASELERLLEALAPIGLPQVLARRDHALALEWVPGTSFAAEAETPERVAWAARLLGRLHRTASFAGEILPAERPATEELASMDRQLAELVGANRLTEGDAVALGNVSHARTPPRPLHGIVHGDFAPENLVVDPSGALRVVDNEAVHVGILNLDLARVWSRWPMEAARWRAFLTAYESASGRRCRDDDLIGWKVRTLVLSAWYRTAYQLDGAETAVSRLQAFGASLP
jgi:aminoglycoside phosphotransferase (APT) family kinase protein